jgi:ornithine--oxo-acid transaminase
MKYTYKKIKALEEQYLVPNYDPLPVMFVYGQNVWLYDEKGNQYLDMISAYSAVSQGHCHPRLLDALTTQSRKLTLTSRALRSDLLGPLAKRLCKMSGFTKMLPMNSGAEAVETAFKLARKWAYHVKKVPDESAVIIVCDGNFHGRTMLATSMSTDTQYRRQCGPFMPNVCHIPYNDLDALKEVIDEYTAAFIVEPVQGEGGIVVPSDNYIADAYALCKRNNVLFIVDEVQVGLGRTGKLFAFQHSGIQPDGMMLGKALSGGMFPVSAFLTNDEVASAVQPGDHGSTFGGSPLACAVAMEALSIIEDENLVGNSAVMGAYLLEQLKTINSPLIVNVRGKGLFVGIELDTTKVNARAACEALLRNRVVSKDTKGKVLRFAPPLTIQKHDIDYAVRQIQLTLDQLLVASVLG